MKAVITPSVQHFIKIIIYYYYIYHYYLTPLSKLQTSMKIFIIDLNLFSEQLTAGQCFYREMIQYVVSKYYRQQQFISKKSDW